MRAHIRCLCFQTCLKDLRFKIISNYYIDLSVLRKRAKKSSFNVSPCVQLRATGLIVYVTCVILLLIYILVDFLIVAILETLLICCGILWVDID